MSISTTVSGGRYEAMATCYGLLGYDGYYIVKFDVHHGPEFDAHSDTKCNWHCYMKLKRNGKTENILRGIFGERLKNSYKVSEVLMDYTDVYDTECTIAFHGLSPIAINGHDIRSELLP